MIKKEFKTFIDNSTKQDVFKNTFSSSSKACATLNFFIGMFLAVTIVNGELFGLAVDGFLIFLGYVYSSSQSVSYSSEEKNYLQKRAKRLGFLNGIVVFLLMLGLWIIFWSINLSRFYWIIVGFVLICLFFPLNIMVRKKYSNEFNKIENNKIITNNDNSNYNN